MPVSLTLQFPEFLISRPHVAHQASGQSRIKATAVGEVRGRKDPPVGKAKVEKDALQESRGALASPRQRHLYYMGHFEVWVVLRETRPSPCKRTVPVPSSNG